MKKISLIAAAALLCVTGMAQNFKNAGEYLEYIGVEYKTISEGVLSYTSAVAHGKSAKKVEKKRLEMITNIKNAKTKVGKMPAYNGDASLRDSALVVLQLDYDIINEDYAKIVDMEAVAEQSYDAMEAYLLAQDLAGDKLEAAGDRLQAVQDKFIADNDIKIVESKETADLDEKMKKLSQVNTYHRSVYLIFFKSYKQEGYLVDALNRSDMAAMEQNKNSLLQFATEGLAKLDTMKSFGNDATLLTACKDMLKFYKEEAEKDMPVLIDFMLKQDNFNKVKTAFDAKKQKDRTQKDVDEFNKSVEEMNKAGQAFNDTNTRVNNDRKKYLDNYNNTTTKFMDKHVPHFK